MFLHIISSLENPSFPANRSSQTIRSHFIDNVACLAIEKCLISSLPRMLSAEDILRMDDESVRRLASESTEISDKRDSLQQTLDVLTRGLNTIRRQASLEPEGMFS